MELPVEEIRGEHRAVLTSEFQSAGAVLEIDLGGEACPPESDPGTEDGWCALGSGPLPLALRPGGPSAWPLRLTVRECPRGFSAEDPSLLRVEVATATGETLLRQIPLEIEILRDPWLACWWPVLALGLGAVVAGILIYGFVSPSRFPPRLGVVLSPEADMTEGFLHILRTQKGARSGLFRDARTFICNDFRLSHKGGGALARLRAAGSRIWLLPLGSSLWRLAADGSWEAVGDQEAPMRPGVIYRDDRSSIFFEMRNA